MNNKRKPLSMKRLHMLAANYVIHLAEQSGNIKEATKIQPIMMDFMKYCWDNKDSLRYICHVFYGTHCFTGLKIRDNFCSNYLKRCKQHKNQELYGQSEKRSRPYFHKPRTYINNEIHSILLPTQK